MCKQPSFQCSFYGFKGGKILGLIWPHFHSFNILGCHLSCQSSYHIPLPCLIFCTSRFLQNFVMPQQHLSVNRSQCNFAAASTTFRKPIWRLWNFEYCQLWQLEHVQSHDSKPVARGEPLIRQPNFSAAI